MAQALNTVQMNTVIIYSEQKERRGHYTLQSSQLLRSSPINHGIALPSAPGDLAILIQNSFPVTDVAPHLRGSKERTHPLSFRKLNTSSNDHCRAVRSNDQRGTPSHPTVGPGNHDYRIRRRKPHSWYDHPTVACGFPTTKQ